MAKKLRTARRVGAHDVPRLSPERFREEVARELGIDWDAASAENRPPPAAEERPEA
jgi:hypothetical protein